MKSSLKATPVTRQRLQNLVKYGITAYIVALFVLAAIIASRQ